MDCDEFVWIDPPVSCTAPAWAQEQFPDPDPPAGNEPPLRCGAPAWAQTEFHAHRQAILAVDQLLSRRRLTRRPGRRDHL